MLVIIFLSILIFILAIMAIKVVREYKRLVIFRLGKCIGEKGPGIVWLWPIIDKAICVDLREFYLDIPKQTCITKDNAPIDIDFLIYMKVFNSVYSVIRIQDFVGASQGIATTTLRAVVGDIALDDVLAKREQINKLLRTKLDEVTERWGVKVSSVEIREILPPRDVQDAMTKQMAAERNRRAVVTEADGKREAAIKVAEGEKQAAILKAEGDKQAAILRAEGFAFALDKIFSIAKNIDANTMTLQYLEALKTIGASPSTKYIFPLEFTSLIKPLLQYKSEQQK